MSFPYIIQGSNITVVLDGKVINVTTSHINYAKIKQAVIDSDIDVLRKVIDVSVAIEEYAYGNVKIVNGVLHWKDTVLNTSLANRIIQMYKEGFDIKPMVLFLGNIMQNPSRSSVLELYEFLERNNLPITPDGYFLAYKKIRDDYTDCHTGKMSNAIGATVTMERNEVDDNRQNTCSSGLHFCSLEYLSSFGGDRIVIVKINPADVVSFPTDYNLSKGRACKYTVIGEIENTITAASQAFDKTVQSNANNAIKQATPNNDVPTDRYGNPLSMTPNAIRKRRQRAKAKALRAANALQRRT